MWVCPEKASIYSCTGYTLYNSSGAPSTWQVGEVSILFIKVFWKLVVKCLILTKSVYHDDF